MASSSKDIYQLPPDVIAKIKSSTSIIHLNGVIVELVKNALDANARTVLISVDFKRGSCIVEDDGDGIPQAEFKEDGGLGKAHRMSLVQASRLSWPTDNSVQIHRGSITPVHLAGKGFFCLPWLL